MEGVVRMALTEKQLTELKEDLLTMKKQLEKQASVKDTQTQDIDTDQVSFGDNHLAEYATKNVDQQTQIAESNLNNDQLEEVNEALNRIKNGTYGICVDTEKEIPFERLKAIPYAKRIIQAEENYQRLTPANQDEDTTRLVKPQGEIEDSRMRTLEEIEKFH